MGGEGGNGFIRRGGINIIHGELLREARTGLLVASCSGENVSGVGGVCVGKAEGGKLTAKDAKSAKEGGEFNHQDPKGWQNNEAQMTKIEALRDEPTVLEVLFYA